MTVSVSVSVSAPRRPGRATPLTTLALTLLTLTLTLTLTLLPTTPAHAFLKLKKDTVSLEATGNVRLFAAFLHLPESLQTLGATDDGLGGGVGRLILKGDLGTHLDYDVHSYVDLGRVFQLAGTNATSATGGTFATAGTFESPYRSRMLASNFWRSGGVSGTVGLDRASLHARLGRLDVTAGRFPINDSVTHIITPNDFFAPFSATAINRAYKPGVDALRVSVALGELSALEVRGVLGSDLQSGSPVWRASSVTARANTVLGGFDLALVVGKLAGRFIAGASVQGSLGPVDLRAEGHAGVGDPKGDGAGFSADPAPVHGRLAAGGTWRSTFRNAFVDLEYGFFSDGAAEASTFNQRRTRFYLDDLPFLGQHYVALGTGLELLPILRANVLGLVNARDGSGLVSLGLAYDASDESTLSVGALIPWGAGLAGSQPQSEFGLYPVMIFAEARTFF